MKYLSLCSGIEAATVAWHSLGFKPVGFSEIEKFPNAVLNHHYPSVPNLGDMTKFKEWKNDLTFDILIGGTPCQSFSVAGLREGLKDPRGNLMLTYGAIAKKYRPKWLVWENVPGVLTSNNGKDFKAFLQSLAECGYGFAYRVLDAQFFGVPQKRKRVFVVGCLGDWQSAAKVLFDQESLSRNPKTSRKARKSSAADSQESVGGNGTRLNPDKIGALLARDYKDINSDGLMQGKAIVESNHSPLSVQGFHTNARPDEMRLLDNQSNTLTTSQIVGVVQSNYSSLSVRKLTPTECERLQGFPDNYTQIPYGKKSADQCPDGPRYKALGNSMAVPVIKWIGQRIKKYH